MNLFFSIVFSIVIAVVGSCLVLYSKRIGRFFEEEFSTGTIFDALYFPRVSIALFGLLLLIGGIIGIYDNLKALLY
jgi:hypothetical protein